MRHDNDDNGPVLSFWFQVNKLYCFKCDSNATLKRIKVNVHCAAIWNNLWFLCNSIFISVKWMNNKDHDTTPFRLLVTALTLNIYNLTCITITLVFSVYNISFLPLVVKNKNVIWLFLVNKYSEVTQINGHDYSLVISGFLKKKMFNYYYHPEICVAISGTKMSFGIYDVLSYLILS